MTASEYMLGFIVAAILVSTITLGGVMLASIRGNRIRSSEVRAKGAARRAYSDSLNQLRALDGRPECRSIS